MQNIVEFIRQFELMTKTENDIRKEIIEETQWGYKSIKMFEAIKMEALRQYLANKIAEDELKAQLKQDTATPEQAPKHAPLAGWIN